MENQLIIRLLVCYGVFLITCGILAVTFIGFKAKTALISGGLSGSSILVVSYLLSIGITEAYFLGILINSVLLLGAQLSRFTR